MTLPAGVCGLIEVGGAGAGIVSESYGLELVVMYPDLGRVPPSGC
jgi:hypothetical protein